MDLRLYNTLTRKKESFSPLDPKNVRLYACGPTVYDHLHIGNGRMLIVFDVLYRLLCHVYGNSHVTYVRNITDVDDKINARAAERGVEIRVLTDEMTAIFHEDAKALGCLPPTIEPRATKHIGEIIALIEMLIAKGHAYVAEGHNSGEKHVLFDVPSMPAYGKLSRRPLDEMIAGARVEVAPYKRAPTDFVLWKPSSVAEPGWESPWGRGRPGWHIECSAMSWKHLGEIFDIHGGGIDLVFPHHENEIAQSCCAFGHEVMANFWLHNGHLQVEGEKMSKSLGNFVTIHELLHTNRFGGRAWPGEVLRLAMLKTHYRQPIDFTVKALEEADAELRHWANQLMIEKSAMLDRIGARDDVAPVPPPEVRDALADDLNTPQVITELRGISEQLQGKGQNAALELMESCEFLGLLRPELLGVYNSQYLRLGPKGIQREHLAMLGRIQVAEANGNLAAKRVLIDKLFKAGVKVSLQNGGYVGYEVVGDGIDVDDLLHARNAARAAKNWTESDRIRNELDAMGIMLKDNKDGTTTWEIKQ